MDRSVYYRQMRRIRRVEEEIARIYPSDKIMSPVHLSIGQEPISVGVCQALDANDVVFGTYRSHSLYLAKGGDLREMMAELYGKATGCARGKGGSMHLIDVKHNVMGASAVVATTIPHAVGYAYALKLRKSPHIVVSFFGEGATEEGVFYESLQFAALKKAPIIFVCENNLYAIHSAWADRHAHIHLCDRVHGFGIPAQRIEDNDGEELHAEIVKARRAILEQGGGPFFFEAMTYRWNEHVGPGTDWHLGYRDETEFEAWRGKDPLIALSRELDPGLKARLDAEIEEEIQDAIAYAEASPFPAPSELYAEVFA
ncbi:MAG TPA: thiamine pyrophosphate-dependent dehydrogenase E1 component subunit alpha [Candidatus Methylacidiphilales bacterium]|nr:thiamine pyrophosphate-dependent dehydrogenase E1 component subunit alpha [Candidatus Methylacidiphilales bacterium]